MIINVSHPPNQSKSNAAPFLGWGPGEDGREVIFTGRGLGADGHAAIFTWGPTSEDGRAAIPNSRGPGKDGHAATFTWGLGHEQETHDTARLLSVQNHTDL